MANQARSKNSKNSKKRTARVDDVTPRVAGRLAELAREMRELVYGEEGVPEWGTRFTEIETQGMDVGLELARLFMEQSVEAQAERVPEAALECDGETAARPRRQATRPTELETAAGEVLWEQPRTRLAESRRDFFPSGEGAGDRRRRHAVPRDAGEGELPGDAAVVVPRR